MFCSLNVVFFFKCVLFLSSVKESNFIDIDIFHCFCLLKKEPDSID